MIDIESVINKTQELNVTDKKLVAHLVIRQIFNADIERTLVKLLLESLKNELDELVTRT